MGKKIKSRKLYYYEEEVVDKRKIKYLLVLLLFTGILLSTTSYAWFTTNRVVSVGNLNVKVQAEGSLEISSDGSSWKTSIDMDEITGVHSTTYPSSVNQIPSFLRPVSTGGVLNNNGFLDMFLGVVSSNSDGDYVLMTSNSVESESNGGDGDFIAFDLFLKTTDTKDLYLTSESRVSSTLDSSVGTENASRVAFVVCGNVPTGSGLGTIQGLKTMDSSNVYIWEPNYDTHTEVAVSNARDVYGINTSINGASRIEYDGVIKEISDGILLKNSNAVSNPGSFVLVNPSITTTKNGYGYQSLFRLEAGITKVRVYMWIEGQDVDCENNASVGDLDFELQFSTNPS